MIQLFNNNKTLLLYYNQKNHKCIFTFISLYVSDELYLQIIEVPYHLLSHRDEQVFFFESKTNKLYIIFFLSKSHRVFFW